MIPRRTILKTRDGLAVVRPSAPDSVTNDAGTVLYVLSPLGKLAWDRGDDLALWWGSPHVSCIDIVPSRLDGLLTDAMESIFVEI